MQAVLSAVIDKAVGFGNLDVVRKAAIGINADDLRVFADVSLVSPAEFAFATDNMCFGTDDIAQFDSGDIATDFDDLATEFVSRRKRQFQAPLCPFVP